MATARPSLGAPSGNQDGISSSTCLCKANQAMAERPPMRLRRRTVYTAQAEQSDLFSLLGQLLPLAANEVFNWVHSWPSSEALSREVQRRWRKLSLRVSLFLSQNTPDIFVSMFHVGRVISGLGIGILVTACPMYLSELAPPENRGWLVGHHAIFLVFGYMLSGWLGYACYFATDKNPSFAWRFPLCVQTLPPLVLAITSIWIPKSPRWLLQKGRTEEAWTVIRALRRSPEDPDDLVAKEELYQTKEQIALDSAKLKAVGYGPWMACIKKKSYRKRMIIGFLTQWGAEFAGPLVINNYMVILYTNLGQTGSMPLLLSAVWLTTAGVIYNPTGAWLHDKVNSRRFMYMFGTAGCLVTTSILCALLATYAGTTDKGGNAGGVFIVFLYLTFQGTFCDTTMYLYVSEIFPTEIRPIGMGFSLFGQFAATIILLQTAPIGFVTVGWKYYLVIVCWCIVYLPMIYFFWPETARLSLEEISKQFGDDVAVHVNDISDEQRRELDEFLKSKDIVHSSAGADSGSPATEIQEEATEKV
ncbi:hypothetical protein CLAIMM_06652 isoform 3 [Cladophialophora immunda]|nr:hypothetical protein CLAIMM_06652 isoform 3 [Cladophialophora immunda]